MTLWDVVAADGREGCVYAANVIPGNVVTALVAEQYNGEVRTADGVVARGTVVLVPRVLVVRSAQVAGGLCSWKTKCAQGATHVHTYEGVRRLSADGRWYWEQAAGRSDGVLATWSESPTQLEDSIAVAQNRFICPNFTPKVTRMKGPIPAGMHVWDPEVNQVAVAG